MNIFVLDENPSLCAEYHCDKHVVKMILETCQLLCSAYYFQENMDNVKNIDIYKLTHKNHPCSIWVRQSLSNWLWLKNLGIELYKEYKYRYGKQHKSGEIIISLPTPNIKDFGLTNMPQAMPEIYKKDNVVEAYRDYYRNEKTNILKYTNRSIPSWV
jgi:hypothetical protein